MSQQIQIKVNNKENFYFAVKLFVSILFYIALVGGIAVFFTSEESQGTSVYLLLSYILLILLLLLLRFGILIGYIKGNAVKVSQTQFPDIHDIVIKQSQALGLASVPRVYILQAGGVLNAFATRFLGSNYIVLYSDIVESAYEEEPKVLEFVIGHELGHIKRNHMFKSLILFPSIFVPLLGPAYSRACEYTCDNIGHELCPEGTKSGLLLIASGRKLFQKVNSEEFVNQNNTDGGFWRWVAEKVASHPHLTKRVAKFKDEVTVVQSKPVVEYKTEDHSKYMPQ